MNKFEYNKELFFKSVNNIKEKNEKLFLLKLYQKHSFYEEVFKNEKEMEEKENKIYTINGVTLDDYKRISIEFDRINKLLDDDKKIDSISLKSVYKKLEEMLYSLLYVKDHKDRTIIEKLKKDISYIQITLGLNTNFFSATESLFQDYYKNLVINDMENKKVK